MGNDLETHSIATEQCGCTICLELARPKVLVQKLLDDMLAAQQSGTGGG
jgi:hypothetical protein